MDVHVRHKLSDRVEIDIPLAERQFDVSYLANYESDSVDRIAPIIARYNSEFCLLDCGADIGLMSAKLVASIPEIGRVVSFEPSRIPFLHLEGNSHLLAVDAKALNMGVSNFNGMAKLHLPDFNSHDYAAFIVPSEDGDFEVTKIDELDLNDENALFLKIDVEGAELAVLEGARKSLERADHVVVLFEAHPDQVKRTQIDPVEILDFVTSIRECEVVIMELPNETIDRSRPFFEQFPNQIYNICLYSTSDHSRASAQRIDKATTARDEARTVAS